MSWLMQGGKELIIKDTELSRGTSSRAGRQPRLTKEAESEEKVRRNPGTFLILSQLLSAHLYHCFIFLDINFLCYLLQIL